MRNFENENSQSTISLGRTSHSVCEETAFRTASKYSSGESSSISGISGNTMPFVLSFSRSDKFSTISSSV